MAHYRITPLEKKSISALYELFRQNPETGEVQWVNIEETYRWGQAFVEEDFDCNLPTEGSDTAYCKMDAGEFEGCEFDDSISVYFEFSDDITEEEQEEIKEAYYNGGASWIYDGEHEWEIEDDYVVVAAPFKIEFCDEHGTVIKEVQPRKLGKPVDGWPFGTEELK